MSFSRTCLLAGVIGSCGSAVFALPQRTIELTFSSGRVTIVAVDVPVAEVMRVWADVGHTQVTGVENLGLRRITLRVSDAREEAALTTIVGERSWFKATGRSFSGVSESTLGRIDILPAAVSAGATTATPEQRYEYAATAITPDVAAWAVQPSAAPASPRSQPYPETMYEYVSPVSSGDAFKVLPSPNAPTQQPIIQPGPEPPVPERIYEYTATPELPQRLVPAPSRGVSTAAAAAFIPDLAVVESFADGTVPGEPFDLTTFNIPGGPGVIR